MFVCWGIFKIQKMDGTIHKHGHGGSEDKCYPGSYKPPATSSSAVYWATKADVRSISSTAARSTPFNTGNLQTRNIVTSSFPSTSSKANSQPDDLSLPHTEWSRLMTRIPKAARFQCATSFAKLLSKIVSSPNDVDAWYSLLHFGLFILA